MHNIDKLKLLTIERIKTCADANLLDLILKLIPPESNQ